MEIQVVSKEKEIAEKVFSIKAKADSIQVIDQASYNAADALNKAARDEKKAFHVWFDPIDEASKAQRKATLDQLKAIDDPLDYVIKATGNKQAAWFKAEQKRIAEEKRAEENRLRKIADDEQIKAAEVLASAGMTAAADMALSAPVVIQKVQVSEPEKSEGVSYRTTYSAEVLSLLDLVKAVAEGKAPITCIEANMTTLNGWARLTKGTESIAGVRVVTNEIQARR